MAFILATDFDFIAYMSKMAFFFGSFFHANDVLPCVNECVTIERERERRGGGGGRETQRERERMPSAPFFTITKYTSNGKKKKKKI